MDPFYYYIIFQDGEHGVIRADEGRFRRESVKGISGATTTQAGVRSTK